MRGITEDIMLALSAHSDAAERVYATWQRAESKSENVEDYVCENDYDENMNISYMPYFGKYRCALQFGDTCVECDGTEIIVCLGPGHPLQYFTSHDMRAAARAICTHYDAMDIKAHDE